MSRKKATHAGTYKRAGECEKRAVRFLKSARYRGLTDTMTFGSRFSHF